MATIAKKAKIKNAAEFYITEFLRCKNSFDYFCSKYILIEIPGGDVPLTPYKPQSELIKTINIMKYVLVLKSRQIGISTIIQAYSVWLMTFFDNAVVGIISKDGKEATDFARAIRSMFEKLPDWMKPKGGVIGRGFAKKTEQSFILTNGSKVFAAPVNPNAPEKTLRGKAITFLVIDEAAFIKFLDEAWTSMVPALSTNQMHAKKAGVPYGTIILSTPNKTVGPGKWFYEKYMRAVSKDEIFTPFKIHWRDVKELANDPGWYDTQCKLFDGDQKKIQQELELKFLPAGGSFFDDITVQKLQDIEHEPIQKLNFFEKGEAWVFEKPIPGVYYMIGVDTAPEHGEDKSAITVWNYETLDQVWEFQGKLPVIEFIKIVDAACSQYPGLLVIESNSYGNHVIEEMSRSQYSHMMYKEKRGLSELVPGLSTNVKTRPLMIDALYSYITEFPHIVKSKRMVLELIGLVTAKTGKVEADSGCRDDLALSAALCFYCRKYDPPLMITTARLDDSGFKDIMGLNDVSDGGFNNSDIMKHVKENYEENQGFVDILDMYNKT